MGKTMGTRKNNPQFTLQNGLVLSLKPVANVVLGRIITEWVRKNPKPVPLTVTLENGDPWQDTENEHYKDATTLWTIGLQDAQIAHILMAGIQNRPPSDWVNETGIYEDKPTLAWLYSQFSSDEELTELTTAISGLNEATVKAIEEAEKN